VNGIDCSLVADRSAISTFAWKNEENHENSRNSSVAKIQTGLTENATQKQYRLLSATH
jgi:hypothetical protein